MAFQFETSHERHTVEVWRAGEEYLAIIVTTPLGHAGAAPEYLQLGSYPTRKRADDAVNVAMLAMTRVTR